MTLDERNQAIEGIFKNECLKILGEKGGDYEGEDAYSVFMEISDCIGVSVDKVIFSMMIKQITAVKNAIKDDKGLQGESLNEKLNDIINYCFILRVWMDRLEKKKDNLDTKINDGDSGNVYITGPLSDDQFYHNNCFEKLNQDWIYFRQK